MLLNGGEAVHDARGIFGKRIRHLLRELAIQIFIPVREAFFHPRRVPRRLVVAAPDNNRRRIAELVHHRPGLAHGVIGEGGACLVVEEYEHAVKRGAHIYAELAGGGANCDAYHMTAPDPEGEGAADVMLLALEDAGLTPKDVDYINVHGTSTGLGDVAEPKAIQRAFGEHAYL